MMKTMHAYAVTLLLSFVCGFLIAKHFIPETTIPKSSLPSRHVFVSSYGDHDTIHRIIYHGLFHFGKKIQQADILIIGNSHAELGVSAEQLSKALTVQSEKKINVMNLSVGWGEGFLFHKKVIANQKIKNKIILSDVYEIFNRPYMSPVAIPIIKESKLTAYTNVIETWAIMLKDWMLDGYLPRFIYNDGHFNVTRFLAYPIGFRNWKNGDVWDYWFPYYGEIYQHTPPELITRDINFSNKLQSNIELVKNILDKKFLEQNDIHLITTLIPSSDIDHNYYVVPIKKLGIPFLEISTKDVEFYDHYHADSKGRTIITTKIIEQWPKILTS